MVSADEVRVSLCSYPRMIEQTKVDVDFIAIKHSTTLSVGSEIGSVSSPIHYLSILCEDFDLFLWGNEKTNCKLAKIQRSTFKWMMNTNNKRGGSSRRAKQQLLESCCIFTISVLLFILPINCSP